MHTRNFTEADVGRRPEANTALCPGSAVAAVLDLPLPDPHLDEPSGPPPPDQHLDASSGQPPPDLARASPEVEEAGPRVLQGPTDGARSTLMHHLHWTSS